MHGPLCFETAFGNCRSRSHTPSSYSALTGFHAKAWKTAVSFCNIGISFHINVAMKVRKTSGQDNGRLNIWLG